MEFRLGNQQPFQAYIDKASCLSWTVAKAPCEAACPLDIDIEGYLTAITEGNLKKALGIIRQKCPLPSTCGRVCHHPCEAECKRGKIDQPLSIMNLKRYITDSVPSEAEVKPIKASGKNDVAIIGSGPAGLTAAHDLALQGYGIVIYEALPLVGGMLAAGIPEFVLPKGVLQSDIAYIRSLGVEIQTNAQIGKDLSFSDIWNRGFGAILISTGAQESAELPVPGIDLDGVLYALPLLRETRLGQKRALPGRVVIIGGGNVAIDCGRTAIRLGADEVHVFCLESRENMPAFPWEIESAEIEGVAIHPSQAPQRLRGTDGEKVSYVDFTAVAQCERDSAGKMIWTFAEGPDIESSVETDWVIIAIGQKVDLSAIGDNNFEISPRASLAVNPETMATSMPSVFAAGDVVEVAGTVTESMAAGRRAAVSISNYLEGRDLKAGQIEGKETPITGAMLLPKGIICEGRQEVLTLPVEERIHTFQETRLGFMPEQAVQEARRCLKCRTCRLCTHQWDCVAIWWEQHGAKIVPTINGTVCVGCGVCIQECPFGQIYEGDLLE